MYYTKVKVVFGFLIQGLNYLHLQMEGEKLKKNNHSPPSEDGGN